MECIQPQTFCEHSGIQADLKELMSLKDELTAKDSLIKKLKEIIEYVEIIALSTNCW